mmetsp:Transcript_27493/g.72983  ORF Transcript_27493/g.72983 Transcript_27493/m.72983 type:complete len:83 (-) Transcript_27493:790-1038(-)
MELVGMCFRTDKIDTFSMCLVMAEASSVNVYTIGMKYTVKKGARGILRELYQVARLSLRAIWVALNVETELPMKYGKREQRK